MSRGDWLCLLLSLQIGWDFFYQTVKYHSTVPRSSTVLYQSNTGLLTTESQQTDMVANKIKSTTSPIEFHGHMWHQSLMSRVRTAILSTGLLWSLPHTLQQNRRLHHFFTGRALTGHEIVIAKSWGGTEVSLTMFFSLCARKGQNQSGLFFWKRGENCVDFGVSFVSLHPRSQESCDIF